MKQPTFKAHVMKIPAFVLAIACVSLFAGCAMHQAGVSWTKDEAGEYKVLIDAKEKLPSGEESPYFQAVRKVREQCGVYVDSNNDTYVYWRTTSSPFPVWTEADGWHFEGVKCSPPPEDGAEA